MGVPPVLIHFRVGCSMKYHPDPSSGIPSIDGNPKPLRWFTCEALEGPRHTQGWMHLAARSFRRQSQTSFVGKPTVLLGEYVGRKSLG